MDHFHTELCKDQVAVVTGGGTGIGLATAEVLAAAGAKIAICSRKQANVDAGLARLQAAGADCFGATCDIREPESTQALAQQVLERFGRIDILINNAGGQFPTMAEALTPKGWNAVIRTNLTGTWNMIRAVADAAMIPASSGSIVNVIADVERGFPGMVHTGAARAGVANMTKTLAIEWVPYHIRVNAVAPGVIRTPGVGQYGEQILESRRREIPMMRLGTAEEVAYPTAFLASPLAAYITGTILPVDGGSRLWGRTWPIGESGLGG